MRINLADLSPEMRKQLGIVAKGKPRVKQQKPVYPIRELCAAHGLPEPIAEHKFSDRQFAFDWAWPDLRLALEVDGGLFGVGKPCPTCKQRRKSGHSSIERMLSDREKFTLAAILGWRVLYVIPRQIETGEVINIIREALGS